MSTSKARTTASKGISKATRTLDQVEKRIRRAEQARKQAQTDLRSLDSLSKNDLATAAERKRAGVLKTELNKQHKPLVRKRPSRPS